MDVLLRVRLALRLGRELLVGGALERDLVHHRVDDRVGVLAERSLCVRAGPPQLLVRSLVVLVVEHVVRAMAADVVVVVMVGVVAFLVLILLVLLFAAARLARIHPHPRRELRLLVLAPLYALHARRLIVAILPPRHVRLVYMHLRPEHTSTPRTHIHTVH